MKHLPKALYRYFWDVRAENLDIEKWPKHVIPRLMDYGDTEAVRWMWKEYGKEEIRETLKTMRGIMPKSAYYWANIVNLPYEEVKCLKMPSLQTPYGV